MITEGNIREIYDITGLTPLAGGYEFTFPYTSAQDVRVYTTGNRTDTEVSTSNYTIDESGATPKVVFIAGYSFPAGQTKLTIIRNVSYSQKLDLRNGDLIDADKLEGALDNITQQIQQVAEKVDRAILSSVSDTEPLSIPEASQRNNMLLGFDSEGKAIPVLTTDIEQKLAQALAAEESAITAKNAAENAQHETESAQSAAETAQGKAETAQAAAESAEASSQTLLASIETKTEESIASINTAKTGAVGAVTTQQATSVAAVQAAQNTAESDIAGKRSSALTAIDTAKTTAVAAVNTQKETSVAAADREIVAKRDSALTDIQTARTNAVNAITTKKDQSLQEVEQLASERKAEINSLAANQKADVKQYTDSVVASAKTEIDTEKTTAVTAVQEEGDAKVAVIVSSGDAEVTRVQSVYQTDLNELKGDLANFEYSISEYYKSKNLFNKDSNKNKTNMKVNTNGGYVDFQGSSVTHPIAVEVGKTYICHEYTGFYGDVGLIVRGVTEQGDLTEYSIEATHIANTRWMTFTIIDSTQFTGYICVNVQTAGLNGMMLAEYIDGEDFPVFEKFFEPYYLIKESAIPKKYLNNLLNPLANKKIAVTGDSICYGDGYLGGYAKIIAENNDMTLSNIAVNGGTLSDAFSDHFAICNSIDDMPNDYDYYIVEGGVNDASLFETREGWGTVSNTYSTSFNTSTLIGALESICYQLQTIHAGAKYGFIITHNVFPSVSGWKDLRELMHSALNKWGIPYIDLTEECVQLNNIESLRNLYTNNGDGWHPNEAGYRTYYVPKIESWLKTL